MILLSDLKQNPNNPRKASESGIKWLQQSITDFKRMMSMRPIIVDENNVILAGNQRYRALKKLGFVKVPNSYVKKMTGLSEAQKKQLILKDNINQGKWDKDVLQGGDWSEMEGLTDWFPDVSVVDQSKVLQGDETRATSGKKLHYPNGKIPMSKKETDRLTEAYMRFKKANPKGDFVQHMIDVYNG